MSITDIFTLFGGLGFFLFGMKLMSEGLEKAAGAKMRGILEFFTKNRFIGMMVGIVFTAIIQSSNATTVMVVSFVDSGLMNLMQASGVILGANIGTTVTGQLIAFDLSDIAPLVVIIGVVMVMFCKKQNVKKIGEVVLGFGILFMGEHGGGERVAADTGVLKLSYKPVYSDLSGIYHYGDLAELFSYGGDHPADGLPEASGI